MAETIGLRAVIDMKDFNRGVSQYNKGIGKMNKSTSKFTTTAGKQFTGLGRGMLKFGAIAGGAALVGIAALGAGVVTLGVVSVDTAIKFESAFAGVVKTTDGLTDSTGNLNAAGQELRQGFVNLSKEVPTAFEELAGIGEIGGQLGIGKESLIDFTDTVAALGVSTNLSTEAAATGLARLSNIFGVSTDDMSGNIASLGNSLVGLGNNFATTEAEILLFGERMAGAGSIAGLTQADVLGIGAAMSSVGVEAEAGGTAVQKVLLGINNAVNGATTGFVDNTEAIDTNVNKLTSLNGKLAGLESKAGLTAEQILQMRDDFIEAGGSAEEFGRQLGATERRQLFDTAIAVQNLTKETQLLRDEQGKPIDAGQLQEFARVAGVSATEFEQLWREDASAAFEMFVGGLAREGDNAVNVLDSLELADQRLIRAFLSLSGAGDTLTDAIALSNEEFDGGNALQTEAQKRYATTESQLAIFRNTIRAAGDAIGSRFLPFLNRLVSIGKDLVNKFAGPIADAIDQKVIPAIESVIALGGELFAAFQTGGVAGLASALGLTPATTELVNKIVQSITDLSSAIGSVLFPALEGITAGGILEGINTAIEFVNENFEIFKGAIMGVGAALAGAAIAAIISGIIAVLGTLLSPIVLIIAAAAALGAAWAGNWGGIRDILINAWGKILPVLQNLWKWLNDNVPKAIDALVSVWNENLLPAFTEVIAAIQENIVPLFIQLWDLLQSEGPGFLANLWQNVLLPAMQAVANFILNVWIPAWTAVMVFIIQQIPVIVNAIITGFNFIVTAINTVISWWNILKTAIQNIVSFISSTVISIFNTVSSFLSETMAAAIAIATAAWQAFIAPIMAVYNWINAFIMPVFQAIADVINAVVVLALTAMAGAWQNIVLPALQAAWSFIQDMIMPVLNAIAETINSVVSAALNTLASLWNDTILPALQAVWDFISASIIPIFQSVNDAIDTTSNTVLTGLAAIINDTVMPAIQTLGDIMTWLYETVIAGLQSALQGIQDILSTITGALSGFADTISGVTLPPALTPGSSTPFETGLQGIANILSGPLIASTQMFSNALTQINSTLMTMALTISGVLTETLIVFTETAIILIGQIHTAIMQVDLLIVKIYTVTLPTLQAVTTTVTQAMVAAILQVNAVLAEMLSLIIQITAALLAMAAAAKTMIEELDKLDNVFSDFRQLINLVNQAAEAFDQLSTMAQKANDAIRRSGENSDLRVGVGWDWARGVGFQRGVGSRSNTGGLLGLGVRIPSGFNNDTFGPMYAQSGEEMLITPRGMTIEGLIFDRLAALLSGSIRGGSVQAGKTVQVNFNAPISISSGMDWDDFQMGVERTVAGAF